MDMLKESSIPKLTMSHSVSNGTTKATAVKKAPEMSVFSNRLPFSSTLEKIRGSDHHKIRRSSGVAERGNTRAPPRASCTFRQHAQAGRPSFDPGIETLSQSWQLPGTGSYPTAPAKQRPTGTWCHDNTLRAERHRAIHLLTWRNEGRKVARVRQVEAGNDDEEHHGHLDGGDGVDEPLAEAQTHKENTHTERHQHSTEQVRVVLIQPLVGVFWVLLHNHSCTLVAQLRATPEPEMPYSSVSSHAAITAGSSPRAWNE
ncbi:hypothetical protein GQ600_8451 [Phytophthora cactorum]|nr:hypothetical protein GQ600_8451 [Phytophthora cactorum]